MRYKSIKFIILLINYLIFACTNSTLNIPEMQAESTPPIVVIENKTITLLTIPGIVKPVYGHIPVVQNIDTEQYTGSITWNVSTVTFAPNTGYSAGIKLYPKEGWTFIGVEENSYNVPGAVVSNEADAGMLVADFPPTLSFYLEMITVPTGSYQRDSDANNISSINTEYKMSIHEITRSQFLEIVGTDPSKIENSSGSNDPVQRVNWYHAIAFCNKLSISEGLRPVYVVNGIVDWEGLVYNDIPSTSNLIWNATSAIWTNNGYRLPTEMEWMWAAMGAPSNGQNGGINRDGYRKYFAGSTGTNSLGDYAVFGYDSTVSGRTTNNRTNQVGSKTNGANELGLYDMSGNVFEWCWDWSGAYPTGLIESNSDVGRGMESGMDRVVRGGCWFFTDTYCRVSFRAGDRPHMQYNLFGFRVVRL